MLRVLLGHLRQGGVELNIEIMKMIADWKIINFEEDGELGGKEIAGGLLEEIVKVRLLVMKRRRFLSVFSCNLQVVAGDQQKQQIQYK